MVLVKGGLRIWLVILFIIMINTSLTAQTDSMHYSAVFKNSKPYRIFYPPAIP